jgi:uncharacterized membrane protein|uniref:DUF1614 domain-containing protein n=1 Tax=Desulfobacca acetoxidans TaxID=60893 RepID=A0A7V6A557_9BACT
MFYPPLIFILMVFFFLITLILLPFLWLGIIGNAFVALGIPPHTVFWLLLLTLLGSLVNIPLTTIESHDVLSGQVISYFGMQVRLPPARAIRQTTLAINVGGALIPAALSLYLFVKIAERIGLSLGLLAVLGMVTAVMYRLAKPVKGLGIAVPGLIPPLVAAVGAWLLCPQEFRAPCAYIACTMGTLIGADLLHLGDIGSMGAPVASIGGAGTFDAIFLGGIIAVLLSY